MERVFIFTRTTKSLVEAENIDEAVKKYEAGDCKEISRETNGCRFEDFVPDCKDCEV